MNALAAFMGLAFALCLGLTPLCRDLFLRFGIVDRPDLHRKFHVKPVPRIGGIAIVLAYAGALGIMVLFAPHWARLSVQHRTLVLELLPATLIIFFTGLLDDLITLKPAEKLAGQALAAVLAVGSGVPAVMSANHPMPLWVAVPLSLFWLIGCTNAFNLIDGMDGLATGVGLFATLTISVSAILHHNVGLAMATAPLAGCLLAFLRYNFSPASVFLGDCGSLTIGFMLGCFSLIWGRNNGTLLGMAAPLMVLALPLVDVGLAIGRRLLRSKPIFQADRGHIHHMVLARGFKPRDATLVLYGVCALAASLALALSFTSHRFGKLVLVVFFALVAAGVNYLGYVEFIAAARTLNRRMLLLLIKEEIYMEELGRSLASAQSADECWMIVREACRDLSFASVRMSLNEELYEVHFIPGGSESPWKLTVALGRTGQLTLTRAHETAAPRHMMAVLDHLHRMVSEREQFFIAPAAQRVS